MAWWNFSTKKTKTVVQEIQKSSDDGKIEKFYGLQKNPLQTLEFTELESGDIVRFGRDNRLAKELNQLYSTSSFHASIINFKNQHLTGGGLDVKPNMGMSQMDLIALEQMKSFFNPAFLKMMAMDWNLHARLNWLIHWNKEHTKVIKITRVEPCAVFATKKEEGEIKRWAVNWDWSKQYTASSFKFYPAFDTFKKDENVQMFVYQGYTPGLEYYALPLYASSGALSWMYLDGGIANFQKSNLDNSINPSLIMKFYEKPANASEQEEFLFNLRRSFAGSNNAGKVLTFFSNSKEESPDVMPIAANELDKTFTVTQEMIIRNISFAHTISPIIMGVSTAGSLGQSTEIETAYTIFRNTFVKTQQAELNAVINSFFQVNNLNATVKLNEIDTLS